MKYVDEYRDGARARGLAAAIAAAVQPGQRYAFMEFCGGHTHAIARYGIEDLLPDTLRPIHGPGCPVCVLPVGRIDAAIRVAQDPQITLCTYADLMRVPGSHRDSLLKAKAAGADIRMVYSSLDAVRIAEAEPSRQVVFFAIGFETTTPPTAIALQAAIRKGLANFKIFCNHVLTPVAMRCILEGADAPGEPPIALDGFIGPAHVSTIIGTVPHRAFAFANPLLAQGNDQACFTTPPTGRMVMTTDGCVISPLFFPGGDIGSLAVHGTINDVAMAGAVPLYLSASFIIEEGFPLADLKRIADSMGAASRAAAVPVITGDTKVVERGKADGAFIATAGIGMVPDGLDLSGDRARPGDVVLVSGSLGDHGVAIMSSRANREFETAIRSDSAALHGLVAAMVAAAGPQLRLLRDPTRGGLAATLNELAQQSGVGFLLEEAAIPVKPQVAAACELLGLDPLFVANEGKLIAVVAPEGAAALLGAMRAHPVGRDAAIIGRVVADADRFVQMTTAFGGGRIVDWLAGEQLPRIC